MAKVKYVVVEIYHFEYGTPSEELSIEIRSNYFDSIEEAEIKREAILKEANKLDIFISPQNLQVLQYNV